jgi:putative ABC transport system permease protein
MRSGKDNHTFQLMAAQRTDDFSLTGVGEAERLRGDMVSAQFFPLLGIRPLLGRSFSPEEDRLGGPPVALIKCQSMEAQGTAAVVATTQ